MNREKEEKSPPPSSEEGQESKKEDQAAIYIRNLSVVAGGKSLLEKTSTAIRKGELVLLVGASGSGKSVFLKLLTGLIRPDTQAFQIKGKIEIFGKDIIKKGMGKLRHRLGIVFQEYGLLDEFSPMENINFAMDHSRYDWTKKEREEFIKHLTEDLGLEAHTSISHYSGGQKKRLSLARTLAYQPDIIVYDEPTAGLDPGNAKNVAELIRRAHEDYNKTTLVVTHEYQYLTHIAHRILYLDAQNKQFREVTAQQTEELIEETGFAIESAPPPGLSFWEKPLVKARQNLSRFFEGTSRVFGAFTSFLYYMIPLWKRPYWGLRYFFYYFRLISFVSALIYIALAGAIIGFVTTYFIFQFLPYKSYNEPLLIDDILAALGFALYRIFIPIIATILIAARGGAAITADLGNRIYTRQIDAMRSLSASPRHYLYTNIIFSFLIGLPLLTLVCFFMARIFSLTVFAFTHPGYSPYFWDMNFHYLLRKKGEWLYDGTSWVLAKTLTCGALLGLITWFIGMREKNSGRDISRDITSAIIWGTIAVLFVHFFFAFFEFQGISPQ